MMNRLKRFQAATASAVLGVSTLLSVGFAPMAQAATYTCTWTGAAGDHLFSTDGNWSGCNGAAPQLSDSNDLVFDAATADDLLPENDLTGATFSSITFTGVGTSGFWLSGNAFTLAGTLEDDTTGGSVDGPVYNLIDNDVTLSGSQVFTVTDEYTTLVLFGDLSGSSAVISQGDGSIALSGDNTALTGSFTANAGNVFALSGTAFGDGSGAGAVIGNGADLFISGCTSLDLQSNLSLTGNSTVTTGDQVFPKLGSAVTDCDGSGGYAFETYGGETNTSTVTLSGDVVLGSDITFAGVTKTTTITGDLSGAYTITMLPGYTGKLVVSSSSNTSNLANGTYASSANAVTLSDDKSSSDVDIYANNTITIDGKRGDTTVFGGVLKGTGTVGWLTVESAGTLAPGHSPGCMNSGNLSLAGTFQVEVGGTDACTGYDQMKVTGTVDVTNGTLQVVSYNSFKLAAGQSYTIIDNDGSDAVTGTFTNLAEGATFTVDGVVLSVTYKGGDGNDVVVRAQNTPTTPDTGFGLVSAHPLTTLIATLIAAGSIVGLAQRRKLGLRR